MASPEDETTKCGRECEMDPEYLELGGSGLDGSQGRSLIPRIFSLFENKRYEERCKWARRLGTSRVAAGAIPVQPPVATATSEDIVYIAA